MKDKVHEILQRELAKLDAQSKESVLELDDFRRLDLLIKAYRSFADSKSAPANEPTPEQQPIDELLQGLLPT